MENKYLTQEQEQLVSSYTDIFMELYNGDYFNTNYNDIDQLTDLEKESIRNSIARIDPDAINEAYASLEPSSLFGSDIGNAIENSVANEVDLAAKAETIAQINPQIYSDWQHTLQQEEIREVQQMIESKGLQMDDSLFKQFIHDSSVATNKPEIYERMYKENVTSIDYIEPETGQSTKDVVREIAKLEIVSENTNSFELN